jgi:hypothetical protein
MDKLIWNAINSRFAHHRNQKMVMITFSNRRDRLRWTDLETGKRYLIGSFILKGK